MSNARELAELSGSYGTGGFVGMKNRLINGHPMIDQRLAGASYNISSGGAVYGIDRWFIQNDTATAITGQKSTDVPNGNFKNSIKISNTTSASPTSVQQRLLGQTIEGFNVADIGFGTAEAVPVTLSFWVKSSTTGTYGVAIENPTGANSYVGQYTVNSANTWEFKSITATAITTGSWAVGNTGGLGIYFDLGSGTGVEGTASTWNSADRKRASGNVNLFSSANQAIYFTGLQLEKGSTATSFDYRDYGREMYLCKRYYHRINNTSTYIYIGNGRTINSTYGDLIIYLPATMRAQPSMSYSNIAHFQCAWAGTCTTLSLSGNQSNNTVDTVLLSVGPGTTNSTSVQILQFNAVSSSAYLDFSAEL